MKHYRVQFRHPNSTPMERKYWYHVSEHNKYLSDQDNREVARNTGLFWFMLKCCFATPYWGADPRKYFSEIKEVK